MRPFLLLVSLLLLSLLPFSARASSHGEAPREVNAPSTDVADLYVFTSYESGRSGYVSFLANFAGRQRGTDGPNFHALDSKFFYLINVDTTGDGVPEIVYQFSPLNELAAPPNGVQLNISGKLQSVALKAVGPITAGNEGALNFLEYYGLSVVQNGVAADATAVGSGKNMFRKPFDYAGHKTFPDYNAYANSFIYDINLPNCATPGKVFVGPRADPFSINIGPIFDLINFVPIDPSEFPGGIANDPKNNQIAASNVNTFALEVPKTCLGLTGSNTVIGVWATARPKKNAVNRQKSRLGNPLVNELLIGYPDKDKWSRRTPAQDGQLNAYVAYPAFPEIISILFLQAVNAQLGTNLKTLAPTNFPRKDLVAILLQGIPGLNSLIAPNSLIEMMRLNTATAPVAASAQDPIGVFAGDVAGYPNGRRPGDDIIDITLRAVMGKGCYLGLGVCVPKDAPVGNVSYTDGAPVSATNFQLVFPYFNVPNTSS
jgi:hypothetical protein